MIYLDYNATTPVDPEVAKAMEPLFHEGFANPSSAYRLGKEAREALETARASVAGFLGCATSEVVFTGGGSEANNLALKGAAWANRRKGNHIITTRIEHPAVINPCGFLVRQGFDVTYVGVDRDGIVDPDDISRAIKKETILISVMHANNETGSIQPVEAIGRLAREKEILFHTDAAQSLGKIPVRAGELGVDLLSLAGHKIYAPKGIGALYVRKGVVLEPLIHGGPQEGGRRAGTENVALTVGLGVACRLAEERLPGDSPRIEALRNRLEDRIKELLDGVVLNGHRSRRLPNTLNLSFRGIRADELLARIPDLCASTGAACHEGGSEVSHVLEAMGVPAELALGAVRLSLGRWSSTEDIERAAELICGEVKKMRGSWPEAGTS